ncbi:MAG: DUF3160 domain-containing protein [Eubacteriales bacterium]
MMNSKISKLFKTVSVALSLLLVSQTLVGCDQKLTEASEEDALVSQCFAKYSEDNLKIKPSVPYYEVESDFSNVMNIERYDMDDGFKETLIRNHFAVSDDYYNHFFQIYENNRYDQIPSFITVDSILNGFHNQFDFLLKSAEKKKLHDELVGMTKLLQERAIADYKELKGTKWENAAKRNLAYFSVAASLLDISTKIKLNSDLQSVVDEEKALIYDAPGIQMSSLMNMNTPKREYLEDYSQYIPRGHYADELEPEMQRYFRTMMWYGRISFRLSETDEVKSSILLAYSLSDEDIKQKWQTIYDTSSFFAGMSDSLSPIDYYDVISEITGKERDYDKLKELSKTELKNFATEMVKLDNSKINTMPIYNPDIEPDRDAATIGCQLMGQRYSLDADIFQRLVYRDVGENGQNQKRMLPKVMDIPAAFGSNEAELILEEDGNFEYKNYSRNLKFMQDKIADMTKEQWTTDLYQAWLYNLKPLTEENSFEKGYPAFMRNVAWTRKNLNSFIGSYTELKHDTILYSAQIMAEMGGAGDMQEYDDRGYVEPAPKVYARLEALSNMMKDGLKERGLLSKDAAKNLKILSDICVRLKEISIKEFKNKELSEDDYDFIREYGGNLEHLWYSTFPEKVWSSSLAYENPAMIVADVASSPDEVLTEATGMLRRISVLVPMGDKLQLTHGLIYANHEFTVPPSNRLTDSEWIELVRNEEEYANVADHPWIASFYDKNNKLSIVYE